MILTILCHGTGSHRSGTYIDGENLSATHDEVITRLGDLLYEPGLDLTEVLVNGWPDVGAQPREGLIETAMEQRLGRTHIVLDGPGADPIGWAPTSKHPRAGTFDPSSIDKQLRSKLNPHKDNFAASAKISGAGWNDNILYLRTVLEAVFFTKPFKLTTDSSTAERRLALLHKQLFTDPSLLNIERINLIGWSRGAVTCLKVAYMLKQVGEDKSFFTKLWESFSFRSKARAYHTGGALKKLATVPINIFAIDPVPGPGNRDSKQNKTIGSNVKNLVVLISQAETKPGFKPQDYELLDIEDETATNVVYLPFPGVHNTCSIRVNARANERNYRYSYGGGEPTSDIQDVGVIAAELAYRFLAHFHPQLATPLRGIGPEQTDAMLLERYSRVVLKKDSYFESWGILHSKYRVDVKADYDIRNAREEYTNHGYYFINEHHRYLFKYLMPKIYKAVFEDTHVAHGDLAKAFHEAIGANEAEARVLLGGAPFYSIVQSLIVRVISRWPLVRSTDGMRRLYENDDFAKRGKKISEIIGTDCFFDFGKFASYLITTDAPEDSIEDVSVDEEDHAPPMMPRPEQDMSQIVLDDAPSDSSFW